MTEAEKRQLASTIFEQEMKRLQNRSPLDIYNSNHIEASLQRSQRQRAVFDALAQQGITWDDLRKAYEEGFDSGQKAMVHFRLSFFYAATAIAVHERFDTAPEVTADFMRALLAEADHASDKDALVRKARERIGLDTSFYDAPSPDDENIGRSVLAATAKGTRKDRAAINRMRRSGITEADLEYERDTGYSNGWNTRFYDSACYATLALALSSTFSADRGEIERLIERVIEIQDEEISTADVLERAENETGVDVSGLANFTGVNE